MAKTKKKNRAAAQLGSLGGKARAKKLTAEEKSAIARKGAEATNKKRWGEKDS